MKIEFQDISIKNFLSYGNQWQKIVFTPGVNIITGANGVGKSSLSDSLSYCLFGKVLRDINQPDLVNWRNRKECVVAANLRRGETDYRVIRGLAPDFLEIYENGTEIKKTGKRDAQATLEEILGFSFNTYSNLVYTNINFNTPILKMQPKEKRLFIDKLFQIEVFARLSDKCKNKIKNSERRKSELRARVNTINSLLKEYNQLIDGWVTELDHQATKEILKDLKAEKKELEKKTAEEVKSKLERIIDKNKDQLSTENEKLSSIKYTIQSSQTEIRKFEQRISMVQEESKCPTCDSKIDPIKLQEKFQKKIDKIKEKIDKDEDKRDSIITEINDLEETLSEKRAALKEFYSRNSRLMVVQKEIEHLEAADKEKRETKKNIQAKIDEYEEKKKSLDEELEKIAAENEQIDKIQDYLIYIRDACKDDNIRQYAIASALPLINKFTNEYLSEVGFNFFVEIDRFIDARIKGPGIFGSSISNLSGGESKSIDLSIMMAFHDVARLKAKNYADILFADEILDSSVDGVNISRIYNIIKAKQSKYNLKVYIISHRPEIQDLEFDSVLKIHKEGGFTKIDG